MTELVLDASVVLKWFRTDDEPGSQEARRLRSQYEAGLLLPVVPSLMFLEVLNIAAKRWAWDERALLELAATLDDLGFDVVDPKPQSVAAWTAQGLTAYDAAYVALAEERGCSLVTDDRRVLDVATTLTRPLVGS